MKTQFLLAAALAALTLFADGQSIGFSFNSNRDNATAVMTPTTVAGVVPSTGWVNSDGGAGAGDGANGSLSNGGVTADWTSNGTWNTNNGATNGDNILMNGYVDAIGAGGAAQVNLSALNAVFAGNYDIYVYFGSDGNNRTGQIAGPGATYSFNTFSAQGGNFPASYVRTTDTGNGNPQSNYALFENLSGDTQTFDLIRGSSNAGFHGIQIVGTGPVADADGDGLAGSWEAANGLDDNDDGTIGESSPGAKDGPNGALGDPDNDGSDNLEELTRETDPQDDDSDGDGLADGVETGGGIFAGESDTGTDPLDDDSDDDGLLDGPEVAADPFVTDPNNGDTDGDGASDALELAAGTDPTDENSRPQGGTGSSIGINFNSNRDLVAELAPGEEAGHPDVAQGNWNSTNGGADPAAGANGDESTLISPAPGSLVDSNGVPTGVTVTWASNGTWNTNNGTGSGDNKMMNGYIDNIGGGGFCTVDFANISYAAYDVYVYFGSDGNNRTGWIESTTAGQTFSFNTNSQQGGGFPGTYVLTEDEANGHPVSNYCVFRAQSSSTFSVQVNRGSSNAGFHGIQIVASAPAEDADGDGMPDAWELNWPAVTSLDDLGATGDFDVDGVDDADEFANGTDPTVADTDGDGLIDGDERDAGTDPKDTDSDNDGRSDGEEVHGPPTSEPNNPDTDGDGFKDGVEVFAGTDPNDPDSKPELLPIGYWSFDDQGAGGTTADLSPGGNDGTLNGNPEIVPGACGEDGDFAFKFDGIDDFIGTGASLLTGLDEYTMSGWVKFDTPQLANRIGWFGQNDAVEFGLVNPLQLQHWTPVGGALNIAVADTAPWTHVLVTGDATGRTVYLDGVQAGTGPSSLGSGSAFPFNIGGGGIYDATGNFFTGCIDEVAVWDMVLTQELITQLANCETTPIGPRAGGINRLGLNVRRTEAGMLEISWNSKEGELYNLRSETGLSTEPLTWAIFDGNDNLAATPPRNTLTFPYPADPERFFAIEGFPKPPVLLFEDNFDGRNVLDSWTNSSPDGNPWELGVPTALLGPPAAFSAPNAVGTVLAGNYIASNAVGTFVVATLRSPAISLSGIVSGTISYQRYVDMEDPQFDFATVNLLDATDDSLIEVLEIDIGNGNLAWEGVSHDIPAAAIGKTVIFEIVFSSDNFDSFQTGLVIDDFKVEGVEP